MNWSVAPREWSKLPRALLVKFVIIAFLGIPATGTLLSADTASGHVADGIPVPKAQLKIGEPGIGDPYLPYAGNGGYDVTRYKLDVTYNIKKRFLKGTALIRAASTQTLKRFNLDLRLKPTSVDVNGVPARFDHQGGELVVSPQRALQNREIFRVRVAYKGRPKRPFTATKTAGIAIGEPEIASNWFPANDHPSDLAKYDITLRTKSGLQAISNGALQSVKRTRRTSVWHWVPEEPMATYLVFAAWGSFDIVKERKLGISFLYAFDKRLKKEVRRQAEKQLRLSPSIIRRVQKVLGDYPWSQAGGVVVMMPKPKYSTALENQTRPVYDYRFFTEDNLDSNVVEHEITHQWFGDKIVVDGWKDVWLNEGFTTFMGEYVFGHPELSVEELFDFSVANYTRLGLWNRTIGDPEPRPSSIVVLADYLRGSMLLFRLKSIVGSSKFWEIVRAWLDQPDRVGSTEEFRALSEKLSGMDLDAFFDDWLWSKEQPAQ